MVIVALNHKHSYPLFKLQFLRGNLKRLHYYYALFSDHLRFIKPKNITLELAIKSALCFLKRAVVHLIFSTFQKAQ